jgi:hypothetical protein
MDPAYAKALGGQDADVKGAGTLVKVNHASHAQLAAYDKWFSVSFRITPGSDL